ncbi:glucans biosynthesis protein MdoC [Haliangium ochraceum]|uniref:Acyltransferase 3 n=1 Tax=Haliangium ochraceum (strain DSM 14365 / JCM 11303 / SMP-2) TaxID=502025 RepID=D0LH27_HALO1|nr:glucans biosynthesis protein MdoC [Haliangium ochraceum]ACY14749.1 acyltransferase 3 [Haliangium ochraceum DSM 14365]
MSRTATLAIEPRPPQADPKRLYYLDAARSILIMLGVLLHAANIYAVDSTWLVRDQDSDIVFNGLREFLSSFRMPAFFLISGFFCALTLPKRSPGEFLRVRLKRLLIPFLSAALTLNVVQIVISWQIDMPGVEELRDPLAASFLLSPGWVYHLWFLLNLVVFFLLVVALASAPGLAARVRRWSAWLEPRLPPTLWTWLAMVLLPAAAVLGIDTLGWLMPRLWEPVLWFSAPLSMLSYFVFFALGMALCRFRALLALFTRMSPGLLALTLPVLALTPLVHFTEDGSMLLEAGKRAVEAVQVVLACQWVMVLFRALANRPSRVFRYLADASYSIYLFHHIAVVAVGIALLALPWSPVLKFAVVVGATSLFALAVHHFAILRVPALRLLFNGK